MDLTQDFDEEHLISTNNGLSSSSEDFAIAEDPLPSSKMKPMLSVKSASLGPELGCLIDIEDSTEAAENIDLLNETVEEEITELSTGHVVLSREFRAKKRGYKFPVNIQSGKQE